MRTCKNAPVLWKDELLFKAEQLMDDVAEKIAPPAVVATKPDEKNTCIQLHLARAINAEVFKERLTS